MLYSLFLHLSDTYSILNIFKFLTVRTGLAMFTSMIVVFIIGSPFINYFSSHHIHDPIREDGPEDHIIKKSIYELFKSPHNNTPENKPIKIRTPPIVGVPIFLIM